jgi:hypothetical protein
LPHLSNVSQIQLARSSGSVDAFFGAASAALLPPNTREIDLAHRLFYTGCCPEIFDRLAALAYGPIVVDDYEASL